MLLAILFYPPEQTAHHSDALRIQLGTHPWPTRRARYRLLLRCTRHVSRGRRHARSRPVLGLPQDHTRFERIPFARRARDVLQREAIGPERDATSAVAVQQPEHADGRPDADDCEACNVEELDQDQSAQGRVLRPRRRVLSNVEDDGELAARGGGWRVQVQVVRPRESRRRCGTLQERRRGERAVLRSYVRSPICPLKA